MAGWSVCIGDHSGTGERTLRSRHLSTSYATLLAWLLLTGCAGQSEPEAFAVEPDLFYDVTNTLVLTPVSLPSELDPYGDHMEEFDSLIASVLGQADFTLIPAHEYTILWEGVMEQAGGFFDPVTGERDEEKFAVARDSLFSLLAEVYHPDALLYPEIWIVGAPYSEGTARWDGTSQGLIGFGTRLIDALGAVFSGSESNLPEGTVDALSLVIFIESMEGEELYMKSGGIQVMQKVGRDPRDIETVPDDEILSDHERNRKAVVTALKPLLTALHDRSRMK
jgi:hypothetical protein